MRASSAERAAALAVTRYGIDQLQAQRACRVVQRKRGKAGELLRLLVRQRLLTPEQARELFVHLKSTHLDARPEETPDPPLPRASVPQTPPPAQMLDAREILGVPSNRRRLGDFIILRQLGEGGMGSVYLGYHAGRQCQVAIKVLSDELASSKAAVERFQREARIGALLRHPGIVRSITAERDPQTGSHYLVQEYIEGTTSHALLARLQRLPVGDVVHIALETSRALAYLHRRRFIHRDIKPDNILLSRSGQVKLADLGLAKEIGEVQPLTAMHQGCGTPYYMPCEQALNARRVDGRSDLFALGATLYHLLTGELPFPGDDPEEIFEKKRTGKFRPAMALNPEVPPELDRLLAHMLAPEPGERPQSADAVVTFLEQTSLVPARPSFVDLDLLTLDSAIGPDWITASQPTRPSMDLPGHAATSPRRSRRSARRQTWLMVTGLGILLLASALTGYFLLLG